MTQIADKAGSDADTVTCVVLRWEDEFGCGHLALHRPGGLVFAQFLQLVDPAPVAVRAALRRCGAVWVHVYRAGPGLYEAVAGLAVASHDVGDATGRPS